MVASRPGIVQVGGPNDPVIDEAAACSRFRNALSSNWARLNCGEVVVEECPELVHPLVELPCVMYSEPSVTQCEQTFDDANTCADLGPGSCVLTAILDPTDAMGIPLECDERDSTNTDPSSSDVVDAAASGAFDAASSAFDAGTSDANTASSPGDAGLNFSADASLDAGEFDGDSAANDSAANDAATNAATTSGTND